MQITKHQASVAKFASPSTIREELACVKFDGITAVATDSFSLVEMKNIADDAPTPEAPVLLNAKALIAAKVATTGDIEGEHIAVPVKGGIASHPLPVLDAERFPEYEQIFTRNKERGGEFIEVRINGHYLANVALALSKLDPFEAITMRVPTAANYGIEFTAKGSGHEARGIVMPMNR